MRIFERLKDMAPGKGGLTAGFFHGKAGRRIHVHSSDGPGRLRRGLQVFAMAALLSGASLNGWASPAQAAAPADLVAAENTQIANTQIERSRTVGFNVHAEKDGAKGGADIKVATDLDASGGFAHGEDLIRSAGADKQFLLFGDTNHGHAELRQFMALPGTIKALADAGVKKIVLEMPDALQGTADSYASGDISRADFIQTFERQTRVFLKDKVAGLQERVFNSVADIIDNAGEHGMSVHFVNVMEMPGSVEKIAESAAVAWQKHAKANDIKMDDFPAMVAFMTEFVQSEGEDALSGLFDDILSKRLEDERRAEVIKKIAGGGKTAVFYGAGHFSNIAPDDKSRPRDLNEYLGADNAVVINLHRDAQALQDYIAAGHAGPDAPEHVYLLAGDSVLPGSAGVAPQSDDEKVVHHRNGPRR